jgi:hypothetical protein
VSTFFLSFFFLKAGKGDYYMAQNMLGEEAEYVLNSSSAIFGI